MAVGYQHIIKFHEDEDGEPVLDSFLRRPFTHDEDFEESSTSVRKEDFTGDANDAFTVSISYPNGEEPATSTDLAELLDTAVNAVNAEFGDGEAGDPTA